MRDTMLDKKTDNFVMRIYLDTIQNIVGPNGLKSILNYAHLEKYIDNFPPHNDKLEIPLGELQTLFRSLYELFGNRGVRGLQLRVGRENARIGIEGQSQIVKSLKIAARMLPETKKMRLILDKIVEQSMQRFPSHFNEPLVELQEKEDYYLIIHRDRFESKDIVAQMPVCNVFVGNLQYVIQWFTGHEYSVEEIECRAMGYPADIFRIEKAKIK
jgi:predicted hydrocarbon binding protein